MEIMQPFQHNIQVEQLFKHVVVRCLLLISFPYSEEEMYYIYTITVRNLILLKYKYYCVFSSCWLKYSIILGAFEV